MNPGIYIHVPFCEQKCAYCAFYSVPLCDVREGSPERTVDAWLCAFERELRQLPPCSPATIYIGGGTPSCLPDSAFEHMLRKIHENLDTSAVQEWTCEVNPGSFTTAKAQLFKQAGGNRVSIGIQSMHEDILEFLGRIHSPSEAVQAVETARAAGFDSINVDLIYGIPNSSRDGLQEDLYQFIELKPDHISAYCLSFEPGTRLDKMRQQGLVNECTDEDEALQYEDICATLGAAGYEHFELSNFARPGKACMHNLLYWSTGEYIGLGPSAHSHLKGIRTSNPSDLAVWENNVMTGSRTGVQTEKLEPEAKARETLVMALRQIKGVNRRDFREQTGFDYHNICGSAIQQLKEDEWLIEENNTLRLSPKAWFVSDRIFSELV